MRWKNLRQSSNVEDTRGGRGGPTRLVGGGVGVLVLLVASMFFGGDVMPLIGQLLQGGVLTTGSTEGDGVDDESKAFISAVLGSTEDVWSELFADSGQAYREPHLRMFSGSVRSGCGFQSSAVGPFYCPVDEYVYLDTTFFDALAQRHDAPGDFAQAYVIGHEIGHHVQNLLGISDDIHGKRSAVSEEQANELSVRMELQADFLAGVWAHHAQEYAQILEPGDIEEALRAAAAIGDDTLQREARGSVSPESFTHGTSAQRVKWFRLGLETGDLEQGDTFSARDL